MNTIFTICAKNYLAQALTLRNSLIKYENTIFWIFLADSPAEAEELPNIVTLSDSWLPNWQEMAFKYDIVEFATSIKPFCIKKLFEDGYTKVMYLDPDMYVTSNLSYVWNILDSKSIVLTPHFLDSTSSQVRAVSENEVRMSGIFNLGFIGVCNDRAGNELISWWCDKLSNYCYDEQDAGFFVDQRWMDYSPALFSDVLCIPRHYGMNVAIWNIHERILINDNGNYRILSNKTGGLYDLLFFHFSGFDPHDTYHIDSKRSAFGISDFDSYCVLINEYRSALLNNGYDRYRKIAYYFNTFSNGEYILNINRKFYTKLLEDGIVNNSEKPFDAHSSVYSFMKQERLLSKRYNSEPGIHLRNLRNVPYWNNRIEKRWIRPLLRFIKRNIGIQKYISLIWMFKRLGFLENHYSIIVKNKT